MKLIRKLSAVLISVLLAIGIFTGSVVTSSAASFISDENYKYMIISDESLALYRYLGAENELVLPERFGGREIVGICDDCFENSGITSVTIPDSYTFIGDGAFYACKNLKGIRIPKGIETIGMTAFAKCTSLKTFDITGAENLSKLPEAVCEGDIALKSVYITLMISSIDDYAFANSGLTSIELPWSIRKTGVGVFSGCTELTEVSLSSGMTELNSGIFAGCAKLESITLPEKITKIGDSAFKDCTLLSDVVLPRYLTTIGAEAFMNDTSLTELFIPYSVTSIGPNAFAPMSYQNTIEITCFKNSYAEKYCYENSVNNYVSVDGLVGDVNNDGEVTILDVSFIQKYLNRDYEIESPVLQLQADVNKDGTITIRDATLIQMYLAHYFDSFDDEIQ